MISLIDKAIFLFVQLIPLFTELENMATLYRSFIRKCSNSTAKQSKHIFSKEFEDLCYKHLLYGQFKQQSSRNYLYNAPNTSNWNISLKEELFKLHSDYDTAFKLPLQLLGTYSMQHESFLFANYNPELIKNNPSTISRTKEIFDKFTEIPEFKTGIIEDCNQNLPYVYASLMISILDIDGYYVGTFPYDQQQPILFILMDKLKEYTDYDQNENASLEVSDLMNTWDFTFNFMTKQCGIDGLNDNVKIFENFFNKLNVRVNKQENVIITDYESGSAINATRLTLGKNGFELSDIDFDEKTVIRRINGMDFNPDDSMKKAPPDIEHVQH